LIDDFQQVAQIPRETVESENADRVAGPREFQKLGQFCAVGLRAALRLDEDAIAPGLLQSVHLRCVILRRRANP
jgi:hypothetical protein